MKHYLSLAVVIMSSVSASAWAGGGGWEPSPCLDTLVILLYKPRPQRAGLTAATRENNELDIGM